MRGSSEANRLDGQGGADILVGGAGADVFVFAAADGDAITDFEDGVDSIHITTSGISAIGDVTIADASADGGESGDARVSWETAGAVGSIILEDFDYRLLDENDFVNL